MTSKGKKQNFQYGHHKWIGLDKLYYYHSNNKFLVSDMGYTSEIRFLIQSNY